jgi:hypothetical protein
MGTEKSEKTQHSVRIESFRSAYLPMAQTVIIMASTVKNITNRKGIIKKISTKCGDLAITAALKADQREVTK